MRIDRITLKKRRRRRREILIEDQKGMNKGRKEKDLNRSQDVAGVTVIWNSPALPPLGDVDVAVREVADVGMS